MRSELGAAVERGGEDFAVDDDKQGAVWGVDEGVDHHGGDDGDGEDQNDGEYRPSVAELQK